MKAYVMKYLIASAALAIVATATPTAAQNAENTEDTCPQGTCENAWKGTKTDTQKPAYDLGADYKSFLAKARTELTTVDEITAAVRAAGFQEWHEGTPVKKGDRFYHVNRGRAMVLILGGEAPIAEGVRIVASHIDSPRLELKGRPVDSSQDFALFQTNYHGGIKTYQWTNIPLALIGRVDKKDGQTIQINIGLNAGDPIFIVPDLSPHTARDQMKKNARELVPHEDLDPVAASGPHGADGEHSASVWVLQYLKETFDIDPSDLVSAELSLVPATPPRDVGFDRRLTAAYGQDDRLAAFASLKAALAIKGPEQTSIIHYADNEESGNVNVTGASSSYLTDLISELLYAEVGTNYRHPMLARTLRSSKALSIDVNPGVNPMNPGAWELTNAPRLGHGVNIKLYGRGFDAGSEYIAWVRAALDAKNVPWQTTTYKVGRAGGGTLGGEIARYNIDTIDFGVPVLSIHTPYAVSDKMDVLALRNGIEAFLTYKR